MHFAETDVFFVEQTYYDAFLRSSRLMLVLYEGLGRLDSVGFRFVYFLTLDVTLKPNE